ncbi:unnamed protein product [Trichogramma brassicae]|uniref:Leucine-rich repeat-containing protein 20 n=1 Tax=Trichogramma brassicae TaxID=86971 RepID=A0A6H5I7U8_9HYME|nr:unnamed protein product [Trichogramma brassicae]
MASGVTRVILRIEEAQETESLDLSECQLMQVPDAVYHLMRNTELKSCDLSGNVITKIPPKFAVKFSLITELNLSNNTMSKLPEELAELQELEKLDISHNAFIALPTVCLRIPHLKRLLRYAPQLEYLDLRSNPLTAKLHEQLTRLQEELPKLRIELTPRQLEEWEDLTI